ncbi:hypothetical protein HDV05_005568 [Chytridiales sp. JEL 0842]|nr:hypothetical protein HDV05_005568 [Chytridiales sp. JEL 0842]
MHHQPRLKAKIRDDEDEDDDYDDEEQRYAASSAADRKNQAVSGIATPRLTALSSPSRLTPQTSKRNSPSTQPTSSSSFSLSYSTSIAHAPPLSSPGCFNNTDQVEVGLTRQDAILGSLRMKVANTWDRALRELIAEKTKTLPVTRMSGESGDVVGKEMAMQMMIIGKAVNGELKQHAKDIMDSLKVWTTALVFTFIIANPTEYEPALVKGHGEPLMRQLWSICSADLDRGSPQQIARAFRGFRTLCQHVPGPTTQDLGQSALLLLDPETDTPSNRYEVACSIVTATRQIFARLKSILVSQNSRQQNERNDNEHAPAPSATESSSTPPKPAQTPKHILPLTPPTTLQKPSKSRKLSEDEDSSTESKSPSITSTVRYISNSPTPEPYLTPTEGFDEEEGSGSESTLSSNIKMVQDDEPFMGEESEEKEVEEEEGEEEEGEDETKGLEPSLERDGGKGRIVMNEERGETQEEDSEEDQEDESLFSDSNGGREPSPKLTRTQSKRVQFAEQPSRSHSPSLESNQSDSVDDSSSDTDADRPIKGYQDDVGDSKKEPDSQFSNYARRQRKNAISCEPYSYKRRSSSNFGFFRFDKPKPISFANTASSKHKRNSLAPTASNKRKPNLFATKSNNKYKPNSFPTTASLTPPASNSHNPKTTSPTRKNYTPDNPNIGANEELYRDFVVKFYAAREYVNSQLWVLEGHGQDMGFEAVRDPWRT